MRYLSLWPNQKVVSRDLWRHFDDMFQSLSDGQSGAEAESFNVPIDIEERENEYALHLDVPGFKRENIKVEVRDNTLYVTGERKREETVNGEFKRYERSFGRFERAMSLPRNVEDGKINATYTDGVLSLIIPKSAESKSKKVEIK